MGQVLGSGSRWQSVGRYLRSHVAMVFEIVTVAAGAAVFVTNFFVTLSEATLVDVTVGVLVLLAASSLAERVTKLADMESKIDKVGYALETTRAQAEHIQSFLAGKQFDTKLATALADTSANLRRLQTTGIKGAYEVLRISDLAPNMRKALSIRVLSNWVGGLNELGEAFAWAASLGCEIRILVLRHNSQYARLRSLELSRGTDGTFVQQQIAGELNQFHLLYEKYPYLRKAMVVKAYDTSPTLCLFSYDRVRLIGLFWRGELVMNTPFLKVVGDLPTKSGTSGADGGAYGNGVRTSLTTRIDEHFESLWNDPGSRFIRIVNGEPDYVESEADAWTTVPESDRTKQS